ncbi:MULTISPECIES: hypothetical protein [Caballeronia]|uniref:DNA-binding transcriptional repressor CapW winged helix-turn-helix domain-containing protein n=1 Tax=Caballeronia zhejiangensis TaxID=871203 RepID=A0A656QBF6_9BURK|nr:MULTISPECIES: hypothetical protein [Caballeronia]EKS72041.1 hypothetical protein BURK_009421 [Burkholderia sp. SJ98]KDR26215.1 hypothetical protein BG60_23820 [Caballeronia zhejiangensis]
MKGRFTLPYAVLQRLRMIDVLLATLGEFDRSVLVEYFGISIPQASADISLYKNLAPNNVTYSSSRKRYVAAVSFARVWD